MGPAGALQAYKARLRAAQAKAAARGKATIALKAIKDGKVVPAKKAALNEAQLKLETMEVNRAMADQAIEEAKAAREQAKEQFKQALRLIREQAERQSEVARKLTQ